MRNDPVVLITGCSSGIGYALAEEFHARGCTTYATARKPETLQALAGKGIHTLALCHGRKGHCLGGGENRAAHGAIDMLVNNAGIPVMGPTAGCRWMVRRQWKPISPHPWRWRRR